MDSNLGKRLKKVEQQIESVYAAEEKFLTLDAAKDNKLATLIAGLAIGLNGLNAKPPSQAALESKAMATDEWKDFCHALALAEAEFHRQRHFLDLKLKAFDAEFLSLKIESPVISRQGRVS